LLIVTGAWEILVAVETELANLAQKITIFASLIVNIANHAGLALLKQNKKPTIISALVVVVRVFLAAIVLVNMKCYDN
jgi:hypothetical protein